MAGGVIVTGLKEVVVEFALAEKNTLPEVIQVVSKGCLNVKKDWQMAWKALNLHHARVLPYAIGYDIGAGLGSVTGTIGPDKNKKQGSLGNLEEFGSPGHTPPHPDGQRALNREAPKFEAAMLAMTAKLLP